MTESLKARVRAKLLRQIAEDDGSPEDVAEEDDPRRIAIEADLDALDDADEGDPLVEELAAKYWVP